MRIIYLQIYAYFMRGLKVVYLNVLLNEPVRPRGNNANFGLVREILGISGVCFNAEER